MSANQLILNLQMADFLWRLEKLQAHGIFLLLCSAVQNSQLERQSSGEDPEEESYQI